MKTKNKKSSTPMTKHIYAKRVWKSPITDENQTNENYVESIDCLLNTTSKNGKKSVSFPQEHVKRARRSVPTKPKSVMISPRRTRGSLQISVQNRLDNSRSQKQVSKDSPILSDTLLRKPFPKKQISDKTSLHCTRSVPIILLQKVSNEDILKSVSTPANETINFSPRRTRSQTRRSNEDPRIFKKQTSNEKSFASPGLHISSKHAMSTCPKKQVPAKRARKSSTTSIRPGKKRQKSSTVLPEETPIIGKTTYRRKSSVPFQKQTSKTKKPASNKCTVNKYKKDLENVPIDNLSLNNSRFECKRKSADFKCPTKYATLKEKRYAIDAIRKADEGYEDDIYESKKFENFKELFMTDTPASVFSVSMKTPVLGFQATPVIHKKSPKFKDCFSPRDLSLQRKAAEEFIYRMKNRKHVSKSKTPVVPEKKRLEFDEAISQSLIIQEADAKLAEDEGEEENEDNYFSD